MILHLVWTPGREKTAWEQKCISRAREIFDYVAIIDDSNYSAPPGWYKWLQGPSDYIRWQIMDEPNRLYSDCDIYWHKRPEFGEKFTCAMLKGGFRPTDAVMWSGQDTTIGAQMKRVLRGTTLHQYTHKILRQLLRHGEFQWAAAGHSNLFDHPTDVLV